MRLTGSEGLGDAGGGVAGAGGELGELTRTSPSGPESCGNTQGGLDGNGYIPLGLPISCMFWFVEEKPTIRKLDLLKKAVCVS